MFSGNGFGSFGGGSQQGGVASPGGFMGGSPQVGGGDRPSRAVLPVTIKQIMEAEQSVSDNRFLIDGKDFTSVKVVGQVMELNAQNTSSSFVVDDGSGGISVRVFTGTDHEIPQDEEDERMGGAGQMKIQGIGVGDYIKVMGKFQDFQGRRSISSSFKVCRVDDMNELTMHRLEVIYYHLLNTKGPLKTTAAIGLGQNNTAGLMMGSSSSLPKKEMMVNSMQISAHTDAANEFGLNPLQARVYNVLAEFQSRNEEGTSISTVMENLKSLSPADIRGALDVMVGEGIIYSTIDDDHFSLCV